MPHTRVMICTCPSLRDDGLHAGVELEGTDKLLDMDREVFEYHLMHPRKRGHLHGSPHTGHAGGAACGDTVRLSVHVDGDVVTDAGFDAAGCGAVQAAASAAVDMVIGMPVLEAALIGTQQVADELGGLSAGKLHAADLVADALAQALGRAAAAQAQLPARSDRTLVAMSGGVDSSLTALLCQEQGRDVVAVTVELWRDSENDAESSCCSITAVRQARMQAHRLGIPHFTMDLREPFRQGVVSPYLQAFTEGQTPNPCIRCNGDVRLDAMIALADRLGAADLATGHYARLSADEHGPLLAAAADVAKDQTYMLSGLSPASLRRMRFPLGDYTKPQVRQLAADRGLFSANKPDSQDLCFLAGTTQDRFLARHADIKARPGRFVTVDGKQVGSHEGSHRFTVGQRRGLGLSMGAPVFVLQIRPDTNEVVVGPREQLAQSRVPLAGVKLYRPGEQVTAVKLRYKSRPLSCVLSEPLDVGRHRRAQLALNEPAEGVAPGQAAVLLNGERVVGVATIAPK